MIEEPIHLLTGANERFAPGLMVAVASALASIAAPAGTVVHVLDGGLSQPSKQRLERVTRRLGATLRLHNIRTADFDGFRPGPQGSTMTYARLRMGSFIKARRVIYFDSDMILFGDLRSIWDRPLESTVAMASRDRKVLFLPDDCPWPLSSTEASLPYFNSGFLVVDLDQWRSLDLESQALSLAREQAHACRWHDQTILNYLLRGRIQLLSDSWNWQREALPQPPEFDTLVLHFTTPKKPWLFWGADLRFRLWRCLYRLLFGSCLALFLHRDRWLGLLSGGWETLVRTSPWLHGIYLKYLAALPKDSSPGRLDYYQSGNGRPLCNSEMQMQNAILEAAKTRWKHRLNGAPGGQRSLRSS